MPKIINYILARYVIIAASLDKQFFIPATALPLWLVISNLPGNITFSIGSGNVTVSLKENGTNYIGSIFDAFKKISGDFSKANYSFVQTSVRASIVFPIISKEDKNTGDIALVLPTTACSTRYIIPSYEPSSYSSVINLGSMHNDTIVNITFRLKYGSVNLKGQDFYNGDTAQLTIQAYETTNLTSLSDMTGTELNSDRPICVLSTVECAQVGFGQCGGISDMILPVSGYSDQFIIPALYPRNLCEIRVLSADNHTLINFNNQLTSLVPGEYHSFYVSTQSPNVISSTSNILVMLYAAGSGNGGKPFMMTIPGEKQFLSEYFFFGFGDDLNMYASVIIPSIAVDGLRLNGDKLPRFEYEDAVVDDRGIRYLKMCFQLQNVTNVMQHLNGQPFGLFIYTDGITNDDPGFGYTAGIKFT